MATLNGNVASGEDRWKVTVMPSASTERRVSSRGAGPTGDLMRRIRSKEYFTSSAVIVRPLGKVRPDRSWQRYVVRSLFVKEQLFAASGTGAVPPGAKVSSDWKTLLNRAQEPAS